MFLLARGGFPMRYSFPLLLILGAAAATWAQAPLDGLPPAEPASPALPATDVEAIFQRLARQDAEIARLRAQVSAQTASPQGPELAAFQQPAAPAAPKPADGWIDVSNEKWTVR